MTVCAISDTHNKHVQLRLRPCDFLVHAGDFTAKGTEAEVRDFLEWFAAQPHPHKVLIGGNHDFLLERHPALFRRLLPAGVNYLENEGLLIEGIRFWGSPVTPWFYDWAFNCRRGPDIRRYWDAIPEGVDILLTHGPPSGFGDYTTRGVRAGCEDLLEVIRLRKPKFHIFGHIHEHYGQWVEGETTLINASVLDERYEMRNEPVYFEVFRSLKNVAF